MATEEKILAELDFVTDKLSTQVRTTALGALVFAWGLLVGESATAKAVASQLKWHLVGVGATAVLTMFLDFMQYVAGYVSTLRVYTKMQAEKNDVGHYEESSLPFRFRVFFFYCKIVGLVITVVWLLTALAYWLVVSY